MGLSASQIPDDKKAPVLKDVEKSMHEMLECKKSKLYIDALNDECIPIVCAVDKFDDILYIKDVRGVTWADEIKTILFSHLTEGNDGVDVDKLEKMLMTALSPTEAGKERERHLQQLHVFHVNNAFIRIDYYLYSKIKENEVALFYFVQVGLMEVAKARLPVLIYELRRATKVDHLKTEASKELKLLKDKELSSLEKAAEYLASLS